MNDALRKIALELLEKYREAEECCIGEMSSDSRAHLEKLEAELAEYRTRIDEAKS
jgi:hypothetical protein